MNDENRIKNKEKCLKYQNKNIERLIFNSAKSSAKLRGLEFSLTLNDILIPKICPILGITLDGKRGQGRRKCSPSLDRIDSSKGYTKDNIWIVSDLANRMKQNATKEELKLFGKWCETL